MILLEVIATAVEDCIVAEQGGANRIELTTALVVGGLTPSLGLLVEARRATALPIMCMIRPRAGGFQYSATEFTVMQRDVELALTHGADGIVFGCLHGDGTVDRARVQTLAAHAQGKETVFHRAFDVTPEPLTALEQLIDLGVTRVLTSGQMAGAPAGAANIRTYREHAHGRIQILPGSGIQLHNVAELLRQTGVDQIHVSLSGISLDTSLQARPDISFNAAPLPPESQVRRLDPAALAADAGGTKPAGRGAREL